MQSVRPAKAIYFPLIFGLLGSLAQAQTLSAQYPRDVGIGSDPRVIFSDDFEQSVSATRTKWGNGNTSQASISADRPALSAGTQSLQVGGTGSGSYLYRQLPRDHAQLYLRYYIKYGGAFYHHTGAYLGGYHPPSAWPQGDAGLKGARPNGDKLIYIGFESQGFSSPQGLDTYMNWVDMKGMDYQGQYYGRNMLESIRPALPANQWLCVELMAKLNSAPTARDGELAIWNNDQLVAHFRPGSPNGHWDIAGGWVMNAASPGFEGFLWRDTLAYGLNWVKIQNYDASFLVWYDDLVLATTRIGCLGKAAY